MRLARAAHRSFADVNMRASQARSGSAGTAVEIDAAFEPVAHEPGRAIHAPRRIAILDPVDVGD